MADSTAAVIIQIVNIHILALRGKQQRAYGFRWVYAMNYHDQIRKNNKQL